MAKRKPVSSGYTEHFGDDFEVTYTDDLPPISLDIDEEDSDIDLYEDNIYKNTSYEDYTYDKPYEKKPEYSRRSEKSAPSSSRKSQSRRQSQRNEKSQQNYAPRRQEPPRRRPSSGEELAAPLEGPVRASTLMVENLVYFVLRPTPAICAAIITLITFFSFWMGHNVFGDIATLSEGNPILASYLVTGGILLLWELSSFLFALSGLSSGTGRGLTFFIVVYVGSYFASVADSYLPEELALLDGVKGGLSSFGSLYPMLFPFCVVGLVTCLLKNFLRK